MIQNPHDMISTIAYQVLALFPARSKAPHGFDKYIRGGLPGSSEITPLGLLLKIETPSLGEAFRLRQLIYASNSRWEDTGGCQEIHIYEVRRVELGRRVSDEENILPSDSDSLYKRLFALGAGVPATNEWAEEDRRAAEGRELEAAEQAAALREAHGKYTLQLSAYQQRELGEYVASGSQRTFNEWMDGRAKFPTFADWQAAGESVRLLPAPSLQIPEPEVVAVAEVAVESRDLAGDILEALEACDWAPAALAEELDASEDAVRTALAGLIERRSVEELEGGLFGLSGIPEEVSRDGDQGD